jgi:hypothetical protein
MNIVHTLINSLDEINFDDLWERSKDTVATNWPESGFSNLDDARDNFKAIIQSGLNNDSPGMHPHDPEDRFVLIRVRDTDTEIDIGIAFGFIKSNETFECICAFSSPDASGSRNYLYTPHGIESRNAIYRELGITYITYFMILKNSNFHRLLKLRARAGNYTIVSELDRGEFVNVTTQPNL